MSGSDDGPASNAARWEPPIVAMISVTCVDGVTLIEVGLGEGLSAPLAPASLVDDGERVVDVDAVVREAADVAVFRSRDHGEALVVGRGYGLQQWWTPDGLDAVADVGRAWTRTRAPLLEDHQHCILDWTTLEAGGEAEAGWRSGTDWLCDECHRRYIVEDELRIRST